MVSDTVGDGDEAGVDVDDPVAGGHGLPTVAAYFADTLSLADGGSGTRLYTDRSTSRDAVQ